ncbi:protein of unknown function [Magnetospirillum sp. XM-1]|nr:protein of unknown function [Magnetospirillum sp. XM-1]
MNNGFSFQPGASVLWRGKRCTIVEAVTASSVLLDVGDGQDKKVVPVSKLRPIRDAEAVQADRSLDALVPEDLAEAKRRFAIIKPLVRCERRREKDVLGIAEANGISRTTIYDWIRLYEGRRRVSDLAPRRKGRKMPKRLSPVTEAKNFMVIDHGQDAEPSPVAERVGGKIQRSALVRPHRGRHRRPRALGTLAARAANGASFSSRYSRNSLLRLRFIRPSPVVDGLYLRTDTFSGNRSKAEHFSEMSECMLIATGVKPVGRRHLNRQAPTILECPDRSADCRVVVQQHPCFDIDVIFEPCGHVLGFYRELTLLGQTAKWLCYSLGDKLADGFFRTEMPPPRRMDHDICLCITDQLVDPFDGSLVKAVGASRQQHVINVQKDYRCGHYVSPRKPSLIGAAKTKLRSSRHPILIGINGAPLCEAGCLKEPPLAPVGPGRWRSHPHG